MFKKYLIIITILIVLLSGGILGHGLFLDKEESVKPIDNIPLKDISKIDDNDIPEIDSSGWEEIDVSDWSKYKSNKYGYEISYPKDWKIEKENENVTMTSPETFKWFKEETARFGREPNAPSNDIIIFYYSSVENEYYNKENKLGATTIEELIKRDDEINEIGKVQISGIDAVEIIRHGESADYGILIEKNKHLYEIEFVFKGSKKQLSKTEKRILSTFKFINN